MNWEFKISERTASLQCVAPRTANSRQPLPYRITEGLPVIRYPEIVRRRPPPPNVYNISGFHSSTEVDESDVERHLGNDRAKPSNLRNLCGAAIPAAQFHPPSRG